MVVPYPDTWAAPGVLATATPIGSNGQACDASVDGSLVRTLSAQARRQAELARSLQQAAEGEEARLTAELAEAQRELNRYRRGDQRTKPARGGGDGSTGGSNGGSGHNGATGLRPNGSTGGGRKTLICIRHGKSLAQGVPNRQRKVGLEYTDAKLASTGRQQALDLASALQKHNPPAGSTGSTGADADHDDEPAAAGSRGSSGGADRFLSLIHQAELVVVSPLTRALQTACHIFSAKGDRSELPPFVCVSTLRLKIIGQNRPILG